MKSGQAPARRRSVFRSPLSVARITVDGSSIFAVVSGLLQSLARFDPPSSISLAENGERKTLLLCALSGLCLLTPLAYPNAYIPLLIYLLPAPPIVYIMTCCLGR